MRPEYNVLGYRTDLCCFHGHILAIKIVENNHDGRGIDYGTKIKKQISFLKICC